MFSNARAKNARVLKLHRGFRFPPSPQIRDNRKIARSGGGGTTDEGRAPLGRLFDEMSDEEFDAHVDELFADRPAPVAVSLRMPPDLLGRVKREATRAGVPYQR